MSNIDGVGATSGILEVTDDNLKLVNDFTHWLSPYLLVLEFLRDTQHESLEITAKNHALLVDELYPLYPKVINTQSINAVRVEARMRKTNQTISSGRSAGAIEYIETQHALI